MIPIQLNWQRPVDGCTVGEIMAVHPRRMDVDYRCICFRSLRLEPVTFRILNLENPIALHLINCVDAEGFMAFINRFGLPTTDESQVSFDELESLKSSLERVLTFDAQNETPETLSALVEQIDLRPTFEIRPNGKMQMVIQPARLAHLMLMEAVFAFEVGAAFTRCAHCSKAYLTGALTGRRSHSVYCSDRCRVAAMRVRNAAKSEAQEVF